MEDHGSGARGGWLDDRDAERALGYVTAYFLTLAALLATWLLGEALADLRDSTAALLALPPLFALAACVDGLVASGSPRATRGLLGLIAALRGLPVAVVLLALGPAKNPVTLATIALGTAGAITFGSRWLKLRRLARCGAMPAADDESVDPFARLSDRGVSASPRHAPRTDARELDEILADARAELARPGMARPELERALDAAANEAATLHAELERLDAAMAKACARGAAPDRIAVLEREQARVATLLVSMRATLVNLQVDTTWLASLSKQPLALSALETEAQFLHASAAGLSRALGEEG